MKLYYICLIFLSTTSMAHIEFEDKFTKEMIEHIEKIKEQMNRLLYVHQLNLPTQAPTFNINLSQNLLNDQKSTQNSEQLQDITSNMSQFNQQNQSSMQESLQNILNNQIESCKDFATNIVAYMYKNKIKCACVGLTTIYAYISYLIYSKHQVIAAPLSWCNWHNGCTFEEFLTIPADKTGAELLHEIQSRYADPEDPTNFIYSLVQFTKALQNEIEKLEELMTIYTWLEKTKCSHLFFVDTITISTTQAKLHKLLFIKHVFATWYATYKIEKNN